MTDVETSQGNLESTTSPSWSGGDKGGGTETRLIFIIFEDFLPLVLRQRSPSILPLSAQCVVNGPPARGFDGSGAET